MAAGKSRNPKPGAGVSRGGRFVFKRNGSFETRASGAADVKHPFLVRVEIEQKIPGEKRRIQRHRPIQPDLLGKGEDRSERTGAKRIVQQQRKRGRHTQPVVRAKRGSRGGTDESVLDDDRNRFRGEVEFRFRRRLGNHIEMPLKDHRRTCFKPRRGGAVDAEIAVSVAPDFEPGLCREFRDGVSQFPFMSGRMGDSAQHRKNLPYRFRFQSVDRLHQHLRRLFLSACPKEYTAFFHYGKPNS
ncbi:hypothetical protein SDC9_135121 [bioreactor metagenome]|uniref:Uncharacterized protein n=1 Tax=bioreactor metagenome TaxID=1076179 RepID=A0A645DEV9_9ZZZZ